MFKKSVAYLQALKLDPDSSWHHAWDSYVLCIVLWSAVWEPYSVRCCCCPVLLLLPVVVLPLPRWYCCSRRWCWCWC